MKTRTGFVANSSSSSFIIGCKSIPKSVEEAGEVWFGCSKDYVAPVIIKGLFDELKEFPLNFDKLLEMSKTYSFKWSHDEDTEQCNERVILDELSSIFKYEQEYSNYGNGKTLFEMRMDNLFKKEQKLNPELKSIYNVPWETRQKWEEDWYAQKEVRENFIKTVESFIRQMKGYNKDKMTVFMMGEFGDEGGGLYAELEHGSHWEKFPSYERFSHH